MEIFIIPVLFAFIGKLRISVKGEVTFSIGCE